MTCQALTCLRAFEHAVLLPETLNAPYGWSIPYLSLSVHVTPSEKPSLQTYLCSSLSSIILNYFMMSFPSGHLPQPVIILCILLTLVN